MTNLLDRRRIGLALFAVLFVLAAIGAMRVTVSNDAAEAMLPQDPESRARYAEFLERFPSDNGALLVFIDLLCTDAGWQLMLDVEDALAGNPMIDRTIGLASRSSRYIVETDDYVDLSRFREAEFDSAQERCEAARDYQPFARLLVSADGSASAVFLISEGDLDATTFSQALTEVMAPFQARAAALGGQLVVTGEPIMSAELSRVVGSDSVFIGALLVLMLVLVFLITRSWVTTLANLGLTLFVLACAYGFMGWNGLSLTPATSLVVFLLVPLSTAFVVHAHGYAVRNSPLVGTPVEARLPFAMAGATTAVGFACTALTPAPDVQALALMGVVGIAAGTFGIFAFVFPLLCRIDQPSFRSAQGVPRWTIVNPFVGFALLALLLVQTGVGLSRLQVEYTPSDYLPLSNPVRADFETVGEHFGRMNMPLVIYADSVESPEPWIALKPLIDSLYEKYDGRFQASWFYDHLSEVTSALTAPEPGEVNPEPALDFPDSPDLFAQLMLWFDPEDLEVFMDDERSRYVVLLQLPYLGSGDYFEMKAIVDGYLEANELEGGFVGRVSSFFETGHRIGGDNLKGLAVGAVVVFFLLLLLFRSWGMATIGIFINAVPVLASLAFLGVMGVTIDMGSSMVTAMAFGIVLDDSTHLLVRIQQLMKAGYDAGTASVRATRELIAPILTTTLVVCAGFMVLFAAEMVPFTDFATVILMTMLTALLADVVILPALVRVLLQERIVRDD
ncbi:MAG: efflux RND transporter permease subunit [Pseudomonadaceae bacterium]|nr:efflux RND transporter permease subunit [Pseudomonadaceae bacterium]